MQTIQSVIEHINNVYGLEMVSPSIPRNHFQYLKRNFYLFIMKNVSEKLFYFLRDKVSPIKFMVERPDGEIWFKRRLGAGRLCEIEFRPIPVEAAIYVEDDRGVYKPDHTGNYKVRIYYPVDNMNFTEKVFPLNVKCGVECVDAFFVDFPEFKEDLRDYKLRKLFKE